MISPQYIVFATLALALGLFIWGRWRYDIVAVIALLIVTITGVVPTEEAFAGFGHPAVITVAAVLLLSRGLMNCGLIDLIANTLFKISKHPFVQIAVFTGSVALFSAFMNNVGALSIMLPVAIQFSRKNETVPSILLMPLAFGSLLGGLTTMIGTPPNIIITLARTRTGKAPFAFFDFAPVGIGVAIVGILFISLIGWRLLPKRKGPGSREGFFHIEDYLTEVRVLKDSPLAGNRLSDLKNLGDIEVNIIEIIRGKRRILSPAATDFLEEGDILLVEADSDDLKSFVDKAKLELAAHEKMDSNLPVLEELGLNEAIVMADSMLIGKTAYSLNLRQQYNLNLLAVARRGERLKNRIASISFQVGDVLLLSGPLTTIHETLKQLGCLPLAQRNLRIGQTRRVAVGAGIFISAIGVTAFGILPIQVAFICAAVCMVFINLISVREIYESIDWSVIVLLGAMIPVGSAMEISGGAAMIAQQLVRFSDTLSPAATLLITMVCTMLLSDIINNAATAVLMAPIAINIAQGLGVSIDSFLMAVAIGASCTFLTPIGHQSNTLVMGPGGYKFGDYWRMGLPLDFVIIITGVSLILHFWPL